MMETREYFSELNSGLDRALGVAKQARAKGLDPSHEIEIAPGHDIAARVEGLIALKGIAETIRELDKECSTREDLAYKVMEKVLEMDLTVDKRFELAVRTAVCVLTEGVLVAPTEGISRTAIRNNADGSSYAAVYFSGPIRSAGGTAMALAVLFADAARKKLGISNFRPDERMIERFLEETRIYDSRCARLQYQPPDDDIRHIVRNCPVCIDGDPTEEIEISVNRNIEVFETNRIRSGVALVICEGIAQKASKVMKIAKKFSLEWDWLEKVIKVTKKGEKTTLNPIGTFIEEVVAGRIVLGFPMQKGGFRLRYGRTRFTGIMSKAIHPATMVITGGFLAFGTQMKVERPGKGCIVTPCDSILGPVVLLKDKSVVEIKTIEQARELDKEIKEIIFLGDLLVPLGDFIKSNHPLVPSCWCEEWYVQELKERGIGMSVKEAEELSYGRAKEIAMGNELPIAPKFTFHWHDSNPEQIIQLRDEIAEKANGDENGLDIKAEEHLKKTLEFLCCEHSVKEGKIIIRKELALALVDCLGLEENKGKLSKKPIELPKPDTLAIDDTKIAEMSMELVNILAPYKVMRKVGVYIGARMARPEKAKEREMQPKIQCLFPIGHDSNRDAHSVYDQLKREKSGLKIEVSQFFCETCKKVGIFPKCDHCGSIGKLQYRCRKCNSIGDDQGCKCGFRREPYWTISFDYASYMEKALSELKDYRVGAIKAVKGLTSGNKIPERIEKGILRSFFDVSVFKDGTCRFDGTDIPITHFIPKQIGVSVDELKDLGYSKDIEGNELNNENQIVELFVQDIIIPMNGAEYFLKVMNFIDALLINHYHLPPYYNCREPRDVLGKLFLGLSPHTSACILSRVIGFSNIRGILAHPYFHAAKRRNTDGDEDGIMLLMDALLNFSKSFLPDSRGGTMDSPLVLINNINPYEIDDEVHVMETTKSYSLQFYRKSMEIVSPTSEKIRLVKDMLEDSPYTGFWYTHEVDSIDCPTMSSYVSVGNMEAKVRAMMDIEIKIRAVDQVETASKLINTHFLPDLYGNLRTFSKQKFRCGKCNASYRRVPLIGKCRKCSGKLMLTVNRGGIEKYLKISKGLIKEFGLPVYISQRIKLIEQDIISIFEDDRKKQDSIFEYL